MAQREDGHPLRETVLGLGGEEGALQRKDLGLCRKERAACRRVSPLSLEVCERRGSSPMREAGKGNCDSSRCVIRSAISRLNQPSRELDKIQIPRPLVTSRSQRMGPRNVYF